MNEKVKAISPQIVVHGTLEKPYYEISYYDTADNQWHIGYSSYDLQTVKEYLDNCFEIVDVDVEPVKKGRWKHVAGMNSKCSECGRYFPVSEFGKRPFEINYCPHCGAKMDGDNNG